VIKKRRYILHFKGGQEKVAYDCMSFYGREVVQYAQIVIKDILVVSPIRFFRSSK